MANPVTQEERDRYEAQRHFREAKIKELADEFRRIICELEVPEEKPPLRR